MKKLLFVLILVAIIMGVIVASLDSIVKQAIEQGGRVMLGYPVTVRSVSLSLVRGTFRATGVRVASAPESNEPYTMKLREFNLEVVPASVFSDTIVVNEVNVLRPTFAFDLEVLQDRLLKSAEKQEQLQHQAAQPGQPGQQAASERVRKVKKFIFKKVNIYDAKVRGNVAGRNFSLPLPDIKLVNLGVSENGITMEQALAVIVNSVYQSALQSVDSAAAQSFVEEVKDKINSDDALRKVKGNVRKLLGR